MHTDAPGGDEAVVGSPPSRDDVVKGLASREDGRLGGEKR